jgi:hypothetical protein
MVPVGERVSDVNWQHQHAFHHYAMLTFAGLSIAKDLPAFRKLGWRIVVVSFVANLGTFIGAAIIAEFFH